MNFSNIVEGVMVRKWNFELFIMAVLQRTSSVKTAKDVQERLGTRIQTWNDGKYDMLVQTAERDTKANKLTRKHDRHKNSQGF